MDTARAKYRIAASSLFFIQGVLAASWVSRLPDIRSTLALSDGRLGGLLMMLPAGQLAAMPFSGLLVRRFGSYRTVRISALCLTCLLPTLGMVSAWPTLAVALFAFGISINLSHITANTQGVGVERLYGKSIMASFHGIWSLGGICAILSCSQCAVHHISPRVNFLFHSAFSMLVFLLAFRHLIPKDCPVKDKRKNAMKLSDVLKEPCLWFLGIISLGGMGCEGVMNNWVSIYFQNSLVVEAKYVRTGLLAFMASCACCRFTADGLVRKWGGQAVIRLAGCLILVGIVLMTAFPRLLPASIGCALVGVGTASIVPICYGLAAKYEAVPVATAITMVCGIGFLGFLLMPATVGFLSEWLGLKTALLGAGGLSFLATQLINFTGQREP